MHQIGRALVSDEIFTEEFVCDLQKCKGICCVEGDSGAPLEEEELSILDDIYQDIKPYLRPEGIKIIDEKGKYEKDTDDDWVTPLVGEKGECAYLVFEENGIAKCGIEKAYEKGIIDFKKPISCHLYPIRIKEYKSFTAVNYSAWSICADACVLGKQLKINIAHFLKDALIRKFGQDWYDELMKVEEQTKQERI